MGNGMEEESDIKKMENQNLMENIVMIILKKGNYIIISEDQNLMENILMVGKKGKNMMLMEKQYLQENFYQIKNGMEKAMMKMVK